MVNIICDILKCQPGDLLEWYPADSENGGPGR